MVFVVVVFVVVVLVVVVFVVVVLVVVLVVAFTVVVTCWRSSPSIPVRDKSSDYCQSDRKESRRAARFTVRLAVVSEWNF